MSRRRECIDISVALDGQLPTWPGSIGFQVEQLQRIGDGHEANVSRLDCDVHTGTHVDAPRHFIENGATVEQLALDNLVGPAVVAKATGVEVVSVEVLEGLSLPADTERLLLQTDNSKLWADRVSTFQKGYVALTAAAAQWVAEYDIRTIGVDYLSVQRYADGPETHQILLEAGVVIIEGLNLWDVEPGAYELICLPLKLAGAEGALARAVLRPLSALRM